MPELKDMKDVNINLKDPIAELILQVRMLKKV